MTDLRQAAQQALEALEGIHRVGEYLRIQPAVTALRTALEQQQAEPVHGDIRTLKYRIHELEGEVMGYKRMLDVAEAASQPQQQAEPVAMRMPKVGDKVICLEDESFGEVVSLTAGGSPDISFDDGSRGTYMLREFAELFGYVAQPQRQWQGLTDEDFLEACQIAERGNYLLALQRIQIKLKERNHDR